MDIVSIYIVLPLFIFTIVSFKYMMDLQKGKV